MATSTAELLELLNTDLALEYMAVVQYTQHAATMPGGAFLAIRRQMGRLAREELGHALDLARQISYLGGTPTVRVIKARTSGDPQTMLEQDCKGEEDAIERYRLRIRQAEKLGLYDLGQTLRRILVMEQEHLMSLRQPSPS